MMQGAVFRGNRQVEILTFDDPVPGPGEAVIRMKASGMCGSDLHIYRAPDIAQYLADSGFRSLEELGISHDAPIIAGHEPCGVIEAVGPGVDANQFRAGDRVMVFHYEGCGACSGCRTGWTQMCDSGARPHGATLHGGHADFQRVPVSCLVHLPDEISFVGGAAIACGTGTAFGAIKRLALTATDTLAVFGLGPVGLSAVQLASAMGAEVIAIDVDSERVRAATLFGAAHAINARDTDVVEEVRKLTQGRGASCAMDCAGGDIAKQNAVRCTAPWGRIALVAVGGNLDVIGWNDIIKTQRTIIGSYTFSIAGMSDCARYIARHGVEIARIFTDHWQLGDAGEAYAKFDGQASGKGVFVF
jgi:L-iditol 2-dehydrogenase